MPVQLFFDTKGGVPVPELLLKKEQSIPRVLFC
jgi:hypothetical protein